MKICLRLIFLSFVLHGSLLFVKAQQTTIPEPKPVAPVPAAPSQSKSEQEKEIERKEQSQRVLGVLPQFAVTSRQNAPSLTPKEKFHLFAKSAFDPVTLGTVGFQAAISQ